MAGERRPVAGRATALDGISALTAPAFPLPAGQRRPVVYAEGGRGSGKTALLDALAERMGQKLPHARADFGGSRYDDIPGTLSALADQLSRHRPRYRRLRFPRLIIALLVQERNLQLDPNDFEQARRAVDQRVRQRLSGTWLQRMLKQLMGSPPQLSLQLGPTVTVLRLPLNALAALLGRTLPSRSLRWFGHRDRDLTVRPVDTLVDLNSWARTAREDPDGAAGRQARHRVAGLLCEAFLADLRDSPRRIRRLRTPVLLLDDTDSEAGRTFLRALLEAHPPLPAGGPPEPLTVVATGAGEPPELADLPVRELSEAVAGTLPGSATGPAPAAAGPYPRWLRHRLPELTRTDIAELLGTGPAPQLAALIQEFTGGHPESAALLARMAAQAADPDAGIGPLLARPVPADAGPPDGTAADARPTVEDHLLGRLLPVAAAQRPHFARCAAARGEADGLRLLHDAGLAAALRDEIRLAAPWERSGDCAALVLRRLLLRRLADDPDSWTEAHQRLRAYCAERGDQAGELHHRLALGESAAVAEQLTALLPATPAADWLALLRAVTAAPFGPAERAPGTPYDLFSALAGDAPAVAEDGDLGHVVQLTAALRIIADPATGVGRGFLYAQAASTLDALAGRSPGGLVVFHRAARDYRERGRRWP